MDRAALPPRVEEMDMLATFVSSLMPTFAPLPATVPLTSPFSPEGLVARAVALLVADFLALRPCPSLEEVHRRGVAGPGRSASAGSPWRMARRRCVRRVYPIIAPR